MSDREPNETGTTDEAGPAGDAAVEPLPTHRWAGSPAVPLAEVAARLGVPLDAAARAAMRRLPARFPRPYAELLHDGGPADPLRRIAWPDPEETAFDPDAIDDPVGEQPLKTHPFVIRKYRDRALLIVTHRCHFYCRFCFRAGQTVEPKLGEVLDAIRSLRGESALREIILSGGDPLVLPDEELAGILRACDALPQLRTVRIHSRAPVHDPPRVTSRLVGRLIAASPVPLWFVVHTSHPRELSPGFYRAVGMLQGGGIPVLNQTVLLRGVNDDPATLAELFGALYGAGVKPYYLHHPDRVAGTARFRVAIERGLALHRALRGRLPGPAIPEYVLDLPDGSGKFPVERLRREREGLYCAEHADGRTSHYFDIKAV
ncbi:MAG: KamA family radical SAM protein [Acidobacteria bacterium]|nr:KamA family radical SAM protein [Acidobacteriota bacterium]